MKAFGVVIGFTLVVLMAGWYLRTDLSALSVRLTEAPAGRQTGPAQAPAEPADDPAEARADSQADAAGARTAAIDRPDDDPPQATDNQATNGEATAAPATEASRQTQAGTPSGRQAASPPMKARPSEAGSGETAQSDTGAGQRDHQQPVTANGQRAAPAKRRAQGSAEPSEPTTDHKPTPDEKAGSPAITLARHGPEAAGESAAAGPPAGQGGEPGPQHPPHKPLSTPEPGASQAANAADQAVAWQVFWQPFLSARSARGFAERISSVSGIPVRVKKRHAGEYVVAFPYRDDAERRTSADRIENRTGLTLETAAHP